MFITKGVRSQDGSGTCPPPLSFYEALAEDSVTAPMRPLENNLCYVMPLARVRHGTVPWQVFCPLLRSGALEPFLHPLLQAPSTTCDQSHGQGCESSTSA